MAAELKAFSVGWSVGRVRSVCVRVCLPAVSALRRAGRDAVGERGAEPELAGWVMNLLLRHSLWRNYTHQSQQGPPRPLTCSSNKRLSKRKNETHQGFYVFLYCQTAVTSVDCSITFLWLSLY